MDLLRFIGLKVKIILLNNYYFVGKVINAEETSLDLIDLKGNRVSVRKESILTIQEIYQ